MSVETEQLSAHQLAMMQGRAKKFLHAFAELAEGNLAQETHALVLMRESAADVPALLAAVSSMTRHLADLDRVIGQLWNADSNPDLLPSPAARMEMAHRLRTRADNGDAWRQLLSDLDRCPHWRHFGDSCSGWRGPGMFDGGCRGGISLGNPLLPANAVLGNTVHGMIITHPERADRHNPAAWIRAREAGGRLDGYVARLRIPGWCPMGCGATMMLDTSSPVRIVCSAEQCPRPDAAAALLADAETEHVVNLDRSGCTLRHPLRERLDDALMGCAVHEWISRTRELPPEGRYRVTAAAGRWTWQPLHGDGSAEPLTADYRCCDLHGQHCAPPSDPQHTAVSPCALTERGR